MKIGSVFGLCNVFRSHWIDPGNGGNRSWKFNPRVDSAKKVYGQGRWRKLKGVGTVRLADDTIRTAEIHSYEASGFGKFEFKIKRILD